MGHKIHGSLDLSPDLARQFAEFQTLAGQFAELQILREKIRLAETALRSNALAARTILPQLNPELIQLLPRP